MAKKPETLFQDRVLRILRTLSPFVWVVKIQAGSIRGLPDLIICAGGKFVTWELKTDVGHPHPLQLYRIEQVSKAGGVGLIVRPCNFEWALLELQRIAGLAPRSIHELEYKNGNEVLVSKDDGHINAGDQKFLRLVTDPKRKRASKTR